MMEGGMRMNPQEHIYLCIDLKSFYASVECVERRAGSLQGQSGGR